MDAKLTVILDKHEIDIIIQALSADIAEESNPFQRQMKRILMNQLNYLNYRYQRKWTKRLNKKYALKVKSQLCES